MEEMDSKMAAVIFFGGACYDLDGVGCNACSIDPESIEKSFK